MFNAALYGTVALEPRALIRRRDDRAFEPVRTPVCSLSTLTGGKDATASRSGNIRVLRDDCARHHDGKSRMESRIRCKAAVGAELVQGTEDDRRGVETPRLAILEILLRRWRCLQDAVSRYRGRVQIRA